MAIIQNLQFVKRKTEKGQLIQFVERIPPFRTVTEKPGLLDIHSIKREVNIDSSEVIKPFNMKSKTIKISKAPLESEKIKTPRKPKKVSRIFSPSTSPRDIITEHVRKCNAVPTIMKDPPGRLKERHKKFNYYKHQNKNTSCVSLSVKSTKSIKKTTKKLCKTHISIDKVESTKKEKTSRSLPAGNDQKHWIYCVVNNRDCTSMIEMPTYGPRIENNMSKTVPRNYHQEKLARMNEEIRHMNSISACLVKPKQEEVTEISKIFLREKLEKLNEEIRQMNLKRAGTKIVVPPPGFREILRKKLEQLNREIRLANKRKIDAYRRSAFIRQLRRKSMKKQITLNQHRQQSKLVHESNRKEGLKHEKKKSSRESTAFNKINKNHPRKKRHRNVNLKRYKNNV